LKVSRPEQGKVFVQRGDLVYEAQAPAWLEASAFDLMAKLVILPFIDSLESVELAWLVNGSETVRRFSLSGEDRELQVSSGGIALDTAVFRAYYQTLLMAKYDEYAEAPLPGGPPVLEFRYFYRDPTKAPDRVSFYAAGSRRVLTSLNGGRPFYTYAVYVERVLGDLEKVLRGEKVSSYF
jgi:hypothetical protein